MVSVVNMNKTLQRVRHRATSSPLALCLAVLGAILIAIGLIFYLALLHSLIKNAIAKRIAIAEGSETYDKWRRIPMPIYYRYYFFNVSNAAEIERHGVRPHVTEIGPFTYRSQWEKNGIVFHTNRTVSFRERKVLHFVPELSIASDRDKLLTTVNGPLSVTLALLQRAPLVVRNIVSLGLSTVSEGFFVKRSARELLFDGYPEMLTSFGPLLNPNLPNTRGRFAWLYGRNNTDDGLFTVYTGVGDVSQIDTVDRYNGQAELKHWKKGSECNRIQGSTDGQIIANTAQSGQFDLFHPELCRKIRFVRDEHFNSSQFAFRDETRNQEEIRFPFHRYTPHPDTLSSADEYPENSCYLSKITPSRPELGDLLVTIRQNQQNSTPRFTVRPFFRSREGRIHFKSGVFDLSVCKYGAPVLLSYPHFLHAHGSYRENIGGLAPDPGKHEFQLFLEPQTGTSIASYARVQVNVYISKPPWVSRFRYVPEVAFPVFWQELRAEVPEQVVEHIAWALTTPFTIADIFSVCIIILGAGLFVMAGYLLIRPTQTSITAPVKDDKNDFDLKIRPGPVGAAYVNEAVVFDEETQTAPDGRGRTAH